MRVPVLAMVAAAGVAVAASGSIAYASTPEGTASPAPSSSTASPFPSAPAGDGADAEGEADAGADADGQSAEPDTSAPASAPAGATTAGKSAGPGAVGGTASGPAPACTADNLTIKIEESDMYARSGAFFENVRLVLTGACALDEPTTVTLTGPSRGAWKSTLTLPVPPSQVELAGNRPAAATIRVRVRPEAQDAWQPTHLKLALDGGTTLTIAWPAGLAITQDTAALPDGSLPNSIDGFR